MRKRRIHSLVMAHIPTAHTWFFQSSYWMMNNLYASIFNIPYSIFHIVGVLNATPDSFFENSRISAEDALSVGSKIVQDGADIIEVGGESTGPKSVDVPLEEELRRVIPVIESLAQKHSSVPISIDTWKAEVAKQAIRAGASIVNDVTAGRGDSSMFALIPDSDVQLVLMYSKDPTARTTIRGVHYDDVVVTIKDFLSRRVEAAVAAGISADRIILDPGLGHFVSSDPSYSYQILARLEEFQTLGCPIFVSPSRKSFLAGPENLPTAERLPGTIAASATAVLHGADYIRTHDVLPVRRACDTAIAIRNARYMASHSNQ